MLSTPILSSQKREQVILITLRMKELQVNRIIQAVKMFVDERIIRVSNRAVGGCENSQAPHWEKAQRLKWK